MRITQNMLHRTALADVTSARTRLARTQEQASSGLRINRPSDDPVGAGVLATLRGERDGIAQYTRVVSALRGRVGTLESALGQSNDVLIRARELAIQGANGTLDAASRAQLAREVAALHGALLAEANAEIAGTHVFAGYSSDTAPFVASGSFASIPPVAPTVAFVGDSNEVRVEIEPGIQVSAGADGRRAFFGDGDGDGSPDPGREDVFDVLTDLWQALVNNDQAGVAATLPRIDRGSAQLALERSAIGATSSSLDTAAARLAQRNVDLEIRVSELGDADLAQVVSELTQQEAALQAGLAAMGRLVQTSLLDFLS